MPDRGSMKGQGDEALVAEIKALKELKREQRSVAADTPRFVSLMKLIEQKSRAIFAIGRENANDPEKPSSGKP